MNSTIVHGGNLISISIPSGNYVFDRENYNRFAKNEDYSIVKHPENRDEFLYFEFYPDKETYKCVYRKIPIRDLAEFRTDIPKFKHDCERCEFLTGFISKSVTGDGLAWFDGYVCQEHDVYQTLIARFGDGGPDYVSGPWEVIRKNELLHGILCNVAAQLGDRLEIKHQQKEVLEFAGGITYGDHHEVEIGGDEIGSAAGAEFEDMMGIFGYGTDRKFKVRITIEAVPEK